MHSLNLRVYYEDTDLAGIVYYANYLKFIERGRTEALRGLGVDQSRLRDEQGVVFAVRRVEADYISPAHMDDELKVTTQVTKVTGARAIMAQRVLRGDMVLFEADVTIVALSREGQATRIPADLRGALAKLGPSLP